MHYDPGWFSLFWYNGHLITNCNSHFLYFSDFKILEQCSFQKTLSSSYAVRNYRLYFINNHVEWYFDLQQYIYLFFYLNLLILWHLNEHLHSESSWNQLLIEKIITFICLMTVRFLTFSCSKSMTGHWSIFNENCYLIFADSPIHVAEVSRYILSFAFLIGCLTISGFLFFIN